MSRRKNIAIFGATGSVGGSVIDIVKQSPERFNVEVLTASSNWKALAKLALELGPKSVVIADERFYPELSDALQGRGIDILTGEDGLVTAAQYPVDLHVAAIVGIAGLMPTYKAIECGYTIALANKEALVCAGQLMMDAAKRSDATILPLDSEHNAIFQSLEYDNRSAVSKIILTASGGPFRDKTREDLANVTVAEALAHPNWDMGPKISIDSATMANKALEVAEAHHLFNVPADKIEVVIHPQSIVHSMVEYVDGSILAQMGAPDMRTPVAHCLNWPKRFPANTDKLDFKKVIDLQFRPVDFGRFKMLGIMFEIIKNNSLMSVVFNAANEAAVEAFLSKKIEFLGIEDVVEHVLSKAPVVSILNIEDVFALDLETRRIAYDIIKTVNKDAA